jgi:hypothetical protein
MVRNTDFERRVKSLRLSMGSVGPTIGQKATPEIWQFIIKQTIKGRYETIVDYLIDLAIDDAFNQKETSEPKHRG